MGVVGLTLGSACQRATNYSICKNLLLECTLGCPLHVQEGDRDVQSPTSRQLGSREVVVPGFVAGGVKANKGDNSTCTQEAGHVAPSYNTSMSSSDREESNAGLFGDHSAVWGSKPPESNNPLLWDLLNPFTMVDSLFSDTFVRTL